MNASFWDSVASYFAPRPAAWAAPIDAAQYIDPRNIQTPALSKIDEFLMRAHSTPNFRGIISMPPQNGKSERASRAFPLWVLQQDPDCRIVIASYESSIAIRFSDAVRRDIKDKGADVGLEIGDKDTERNWRLKGHRGGMYAVGVGGALTSRPADLMIIDDPAKGYAEAASPTYQRKTWDWWTGTALSRVQGGSSVIVILTRWHDDDLAGQLMRKDPGMWEFLRIPAQADHRPEIGESDPLGREPGEYMKSVQGFTTREWEMRKKSSGPKIWSALYQGTPSPDEGGIFPGEWARYSTPMWVENADGSRTVPGMGRDDYELIQSWDLAFKATDSSDYVVGQVWLRVGTRAYLLDMVRDRLNFNDTLTAIRRMTAKWPQAVAKYVEDKANGPAVMNSLAGQVNGLIPVEPEGSKIARANAVSPFAFSHDIVLPDDALLPNVGELVEESKLFPASSHDDTVDALTQAVNQLLLRPLPTDGGVRDAEEWELMDAQGWSISQY